jgi:hypothetical protein
VYEGGAFLWRGNPVHRVDIVGRAQTLDRQEEVSYHAANNLGPRIAGWRDDNALEVDEAWT